MVNLAYIKIPIFYSVDVPGMAHDVLDLCIHSYLSTHFNVIWFQIGERILSRVHVYKKESSWINGFATKA